MKNEMIKFLKCDLEQGVKVMEHIYAHKSASNRLKARGKACSDVLSIYFVKSSHLGLKVPTNLSEFGV